MPSIRAMPSTRSPSAPPATIDFAVARPDGRQPARGRERPVADVGEHDRVRVDPRRHFLELPADRRQPLLANGRIGVRPGLGRVRVHGGLQARALGQRGHLFAELALTPGLDRREHPLAGLEVGRHRLPDLIANADRHEHEDADQQQRHRREGDRERLDEQARRPPAVRHGWSSTGTVRLTVAVWPASTRTVSVRSPTRSCHPTSVYRPAGTLGSSNAPSTEGIVKYG